MSETHPVTSGATKFRGEIELIKEGLEKFLGLLEDEMRPLTQGEDRKEEVENAKLAFRHLEDAKMRLGKVIQAVEGKSVYDQ